MHPTRRRAAVSALIAAIVLWGCSGGIDAQLGEIRALQDAGEFSASIDPLRNLLASHPDHPEANFLLGAALVQTRQPSLAVWPLRKASESEAYAVSAGLLLANTLYSMQSFDEAVRAADGVLAAEPENLIALQLRATAHQGAGRQEATLEDVERLLALEPDSTAGLALKAIAFEKLGRTSDAEQTLIVLTRVGEASGDPNVELHACTALATFYGDHSVERAAPAFEKCFERFPSELLLLQQAARYYDPRGERARVDERWRHAIEERPDHFGLRSGLAERLTARGDLEEAEAVLRETAETFQSASTWNALSRHYQDRKRYAEAKQALDRAAELAGGDGGDELRFRQADLLVDMGELDAAEKLADELGQEVYGTLIRGRVWMERDDAPRALEALETGLARWPNNAGARYLAGYAAEQLGDYPKAIAHYREAVRSSPEATDADLALARLELATGNHREALSFAAHHLEKRGTHPGEAHRIAARAAAALGQTDVAHRQLERLAAVDDDVLAVALERAAIERELSGPAASAEVIRGSGLDLRDPANAPALRFLVQDELALGRSDVALAALGEALAAHPRDPSLLDARGRTLLQLGDREAARESFRLAVAGDPDFAPALTGLGRLALEGGDPDTALDYFDRAAESGGADPEAAYFAAQLQLQRGERADAAERLRAILHSHPDSWQASNDLAWLLAEDRQDLSRALELAQRAVRLSASANTLDTLGFVQLQRGEVAAAAASFKRALDLQPEAASTRYRLGVAQRSLGREQEAAASFRAALDLGQFPEAEAARAELGELEQRS